MRGVDMNKRRVVVIVAASLLGLVVVGWVAAFALSGMYGTTGISTQTTVSQPDSGSAIQREAATGYSGAAAPMAAQDAAKGTSTSANLAATVDAAGTDRQIIRTASVTMTVKKVPVAIEKLRGLVAAAGGEISSLTYSAGVEQPMPLPMAESGSSATTGPQSATVVVRVPASKLLPLTRTVAGLGEVTAQTAGQEDITAQVVDLEARLKNLRAEEVRLRSFLNKANRVADMLSIERELSRVRGEIEAMEAQRRYLADQVEMATLTVTLSQPAPVVTPAGTNWGFGQAVTRGVQAAAAVIGSIITVGIAILPVVAAILLAWWLVALWRRRHPKTTPPAVETSTE
jgi:Domain of unknown function (DUF4349)